jgi:hypothetical protein
LAICASEPLGGDPRPPPHRRIALDGSAGLQRFTALQLLSRHPLRPTRYPLRPAVPPNRYVVGHLSPTTVTDATATGAGWFSAFRPTPRHRRGVSWFGSPNHERRSAPAGWHGTTPLRAATGEPSEKRPEGVRRVRLSSTERREGKPAALGKKNSRFLSGSGGTDEVLPDILPQLLRYLLLAYPGTVGEQSCFVGVRDEQGLGDGGGHVALYQHPGETYE